MKEEAREVQDYISIMTIVKELVGIKEKCLVVTTVA